MQACVGGEGLELLRAELVVDEPCKSQRVAEELLTSDGVVEDEHRCEDEEDVLEDSRHGEDNRRSVPDLMRC